MDNPPTPLKGMGNPPTPLKGGLNQDKAPLPWERGWGEAGKETRFRGFRSKKRKR